MMTKEDNYGFDKLPKWLQELWELNPSIARRAEKYIAELSERQENTETFEQHDSKALHIADVMHRFYMQIGKDHNIPTERILLAITDNGKNVQAYSTNLEETELTYLQDYSLPNGA